MKNLKSMFRILSLSLIAIVLFAQCEKSTVEPQTRMGSASFEMTDAPIDNAEIQSVFVTVTEVKVDGQTFSGFSGKQTIDLLAYQNGNVKALGLGQLEAGTYSNVTLVLDYEIDAQGNAPGCYVETVNGTKHDLEAQGRASQELVISKTFTIQEDTRSTIVFDFDVRKAIKANTSGSSDYSFVSDAELRSSIRAINRDMSGELQGQVDDNSTASSDRIIVYAYKKGTWNENMETQGQGESNIMFKNAVTSSVVTGNGDYTLAFLEEGEYEVYFAGYEDNNNDGKFEFQGVFEIDGLLGINSGAVDIEAGIQASLNVSITALIP